MFASISLLCAQVLLSGAEPTHRERLLVEADAVRVTTPLVRIVITQRVGLSYLHVWTPGPKQDWQHAFRAIWPGPKPKRGQAYVVHGLLKAFPKKLRVGLTGYYTGPAFVDSVSLVAPDGRELYPTTVTAVNQASRVESIRKTDGKPVTLSHHVTQREQVDGVELTFAVPPRLRSQVKPMRFGRVPLPPARYGYYGPPGGISDPHMVPLGYTYKPDIDALARHDFTIFQCNAPKVFARILRQNPRHRIILRGAVPRAGDHLDWAYDADKRKQILAAQLRFMSPQTEQIYGYTFSEEELGHLCRAWYGQKPQAWAVKYRKQFEQETGKPFVWRTEAVRVWLAGHVKAYYNGLYSAIKREHPHLKIYPWIYVPGDRSGWGWVTLDELKADGWIYQWFPHGAKPIAKRVVHARKDITWAVVHVNYIDCGIDQLRRAGVPNDELYVQIWSFQPTDKPLEQIRDLRAMGVANIFNFYYCGMLVPPMPPLSNPADLAFEVRGARATVASRPKVVLWRGVGLGLAQCVAAPGPVTGAAIHVRTTKPAVLAVTIERGAGKPDGKPLFRQQVAVSAAPAGAWLPVSATVPDAKRGERLWITLRPVTGKPTPQVGWSDRGPYASGYVVPWEKHGSHFNGWRLSEAKYLNRIGAWEDSYRFRRQFEALFMQKGHRP